MTGLQTLIYKEVLRFWKVAFQTIGGPVLNANHRLPIERKAEA